MESSWFLGVFYFLPCLVLSQSQHTPSSGVSFLRWSPADGHTLLMFLRHSAGGACSLYLSSWSDDDLRLRACQILSSPDVTEGYRAFCERRETRHRETLRFNVSLLLSEDAPCVIVPSGQFSVRKRDGDADREARTRRRRSWIFPGTLWCGTGSRADGFEQLGMFERADKCCREHDHCSDVIPAFKVNYGVFNPKFFTVSHCECDQRFRNCLLGMNDSISSMVGYSFFSILKIPCFELKQQRHCTQMYWWGMCKKATEAPYAIFKTPLPYNSSDVLDKHVQSDSNNSSKEQHQFERPVSNPQNKVLESKHRCGIRDPARGDTFYHKRIKGSGCRRHKTISREGPPQKPTKPTDIFMSRSKILKRNGKKKNRRKDPSGVVQKSNMPPTIPTTTSAEISSAAINSRIPVLTRSLNLQKDPTEVKRVTKHAKVKQKVPKHRKCCGSSMAVSKHAPPLLCKRCLKKKPTSATTVTTTKTYTENLDVNKRQKHEKNRMRTPNQETLATVRGAATVATPTEREQKMTASHHEKGKPQKQLNFPPLWKQVGQQPLGQTTTKNVQAENILVKIDKNLNMTDNKLRCRSLKHLDDCEFKILPLEEKYNLTNVDSRTAYHCDCTSRLAAQIRRLKDPSPVRSLLVEYVSQDCFTLSEGNTCKHTKRCSGGFTKAPDPHQALKKEEKYFAATRGSSSRNKRIPVRLYKYCLRL